MFLFLFIAFGARLISFDARDRCLKVIRPARDRPSHTETSEGKNIDHTP